jgi:hypothetical protein
MKNKLKNIMFAIMLAPLIANGQVKDSKNDSLKLLFNKINEQLSNISIEKTKYFTNKTAALTTNDGTPLTSNGALLTIEKKVYNCLYSVDSLSIKSTDNNSNINGKISLNLKFIINKNSGDISNNTIDSIMNVSFIYPTGLIEKNCEISIKDNINTDYIMFNKLPHKVTAIIKLNASNFVKGIGEYRILFFTKDCNICEYVFKLDL